MLGVAPDLLVLQKTNYCPIRTMLQEIEHAVHNEMLCMEIFN
jgi:hypothetical protein